MSRARASERDLTALFVPVRGAKGSGVLLLALAGALLALPSLAAQHRAERGPERVRAQAGRSVETAAPRPDSVRKPPGARASRTSGDRGALRSVSADGDVDGRLGGRILFDYSAGGIDERVAEVTGPMEDGTEFRRARLFAEGTLYGIGYKFQVDVAGAPDINDMYLEFPSPLPNSDVKVGKFKEDLSLVERTSSKYITFAARPLLTEFTGGRDLGVRLGGRAVGGAFTYGVGGYRATVDDALGTSRGDGEYKGTARVTYVPWSRDGTRRLLHVGASGSVARLDADLPPAEQPTEAHEPEVHLAPDFVDTGPLDAERATQLGLELALVYDAVSIQAESLRKHYDLDAGRADPTFGAWYVSGSYVLTGEHRPYEGGAFGRLRPRESVRAGEEGGVGAWELAARYSTMDLADGGRAGGQVQTVTLGVNWYLNPAVRIIANYVLATADAAAGTAGVDGDGRFVTVRFQADF